MNNHSTDELLLQYNELLTNNNNLKREIGTTNDKIKYLISNVNKDIQVYNNNGNSIDELREQLLGRSMKIKNNYIKECIKYLLINSDEMSIMERVVSGLKYDSSKSIVEQYNINSTINEGDNIIAIAQTVAYRSKFGDTAYIPAEYKEYNLLYFRI